MFFMPLATASESSEVLKSSPAEKAVLGDVVAPVLRLPWERTEVLLLESRAQLQ